MPWVANRREVSLSRRAVLQLQESCSQCSFLHSEHRFEILHVPSRISHHQAIKRISILRQSVLTGWLITVGDMMLLMLLISEHHPAAYMLLIAAFHADGDEDESQSCHGSAYGLCCPAP